MRLFYVAATRARDHLLLIGRAPTPGVRATTRLGLLDEIFAAEEMSFGDGPGAATARRMRVTRTARAPAGRPPLLPGDPPAAPPAAPLPAPSTPAIVLPADDAGRFLACPRRVFLERVVGASGEERTTGERRAELPASETDDDAAADGSAIAIEGAGNAAEAPSAVGAEGGAAPTDPRLRGTAIHAAFEAFALGRDVAVRARDAAFEAGVADPEIAAAIARDAVAATARFAASETGRRVVSAPRATVFSECALTFGDGSVRFQGRADLVVCGGGPGLVVDYKTSSRGRTDAKDLRALAERAGYRAQVEIYAAALATATDTEVDAMIYFTDTGLAVPVVGQGEGANPVHRVAAEWKSRLLRAAIAPDAFPMTEDRRRCRTCPHLASGLCSGAGA
jgi:ATP-dependent exoDNAse (exonuclease V) beta subunit